MLESQTSDESINIETLAEDLDAVYRDRLCALVRRQMHPRYLKRDDPEDVVQSVFRTFYRRASLGQFRFDHDGALWKLLQLIAKRKMIKRVAYHDAERRDIRREDADSADFEPELDADQAAAAQMLGDALEQALSGLNYPEPELYQLTLHGYSIVEIVDKVLTGLPDGYPEILQCRLQGMTETAIARRMGCGREAVRYRLIRIRQRMQELLGDGPD